MNAPYPLKNKLVTYPTSVNSAQENSEKKDTCTRAKNAQIPTLGSRTNSEWTLNDDEWLEWSLKCAKKCADDHIAPDADVVVGGGDFWFLFNLEHFQICFTTVLRKSAYSCHSLYSNLGRNITYFSIHSHKGSSHQNVLKEFVRSRFMTKILRSSFETFSSLVTCFKQVQISVLGKLW